VETISKYRLSDEALHAVRLGAIQSLRLIPTALEWVGRELSNVKACTNTGASWKEAMSRIDESAWMKHCQGMYDSCLANPGFEDQLNALPPPRKPPHSRVQIVPDELQREAQRILADAYLWQALGRDLRLTLLEERGEGGEPFFDENSLLKAQRLEDGTLRFESGLIFHDRMDHCRSYFN
jgi:hypothetical protein